MFRRYKLPKVLALCSMVTISCTSVNEESIKVDCSASDLEITGVNTTLATCTTGGTTEVLVTGGEEIYTFTIGNSEQTESTFSNLPAGSYTVEVTDANGCSVTGDFEITGGDDTISAAAEITPSGCDDNNGQIVINASGGDQNFTYSLNGGDFQSENTFTGLAVEEYSIKVKDGNGCLAELTVNVAINITLSGNIMPIIETNCAISGCHKDIRNPFLITKEAIIQNASRIAARTSSTTIPMPPGNPLPPSEIDAITCWVESGALDN